MMQSWLKTPLRTYIAAERERAALTVFQHIPKTAGSSLVAEMNRNIGNYRGIFIDYTNLPAVGGVDDLMMESVKAFLASYDPAQVYCASGHIRRRHVEHIAETVPQTRFVTFLRDPVDRVISDYRYQCTDQHPPYLEFREKYPHIDDYVAVRGTGDKMWHFLVDDDVSVEEGIDRIENRFSFIGIKEHYPLSVNVMMLMHDRDVMPRMHVRPTKNITENAVRQDAELRARIAAANPRDMALYRHFRDMLLARRDEWRALKQEINLARIETLRRGVAEPQTVKQLLATAGG